MNLPATYLQNYQANIEKQLSSFVTELKEVDASVELTVSPNGKEIIYWRVINWNAAGYDKLITLNVI